MTSLSLVGESSGPKVAARSTVSSAVATKKQPIICAVCEQKIVGGKDQAIFFKEYVSTGCTITAPEFSFPILKQ